MLFGHFGRAPAILANVEFSATFFVAKRELDLVYFVQVRLETATLRELAVAFAALEWPHPRVGSRVTFQIERVVEALLTECAQVALYIAVVLHVTVH